MSASLISTSSCVPTAWWKTPAAASSLPIPGAQGVHIFDPVQQKYKFIERKEKSKDAMLAPQCVAVDSKDNIYVSDSESGKIFVFNSDGKYQHALGSLKGGEGFFKRPTGIAVDSDEQKIYITDTLRNKIFVTDMNGNVLQTIGKNGDASASSTTPPSCGWTAKTCSWSMP